MQALLEVNKIPFEKEKASDENKQVPNLPILFNSLCPLLRYEIPTENLADDKVLLQYDYICAEIANTVSTIASYGI